MPQLPDHPCIGPGPKRPIHASPRGAATGKPLILVVEDDWRALRFICTVLKYSTDALVIASSRPGHALWMSRSLERPIDLLIMGIELEDPANGIGLARKIAAGHPSMGVLLMSGRNPPPDLPSAWRFLSIPFPTAAFLDCVSHFCGCGDSVPGTRR